MTEHRANEIPFNNDPQLALFEDTTFAERDVSSPLVSLLGQNTLSLAERHTKPGIDTVEEVIELERDHRALAYVRNFYYQPELNDLDRALAPLYAPMHSVDIIGNQFARRVLPAFLESDSSEALKKLRKLQPNTTQEEMVVLINDEQFQNLHALGRANIG